MLTDTPILTRILILLLLSGTLHAERPQLPEWKRRRSALDKVHAVDEFRIFYTLGGDDALPDVVDLNKNSIPDRIENIALQFVTARRLYADVLKLRHPLESPRYKGKAKFIDVHVGSLPLAPGGAKNNGVAGDAVVNYYRPNDPESGVDVLTVDISKTLATRNLTPAHELFHLFQYGYTMFKVGWFLEGTARWSEFTFREGSGEPTKLPETEADLQRLFSLKYEAEGFWSHLAHITDPEGQLDIPTDLRNIHYIATDEPIIRETKIHGAVFIRQLLEALDKKDDEVTTELQLKTFAWKESRQRSSDNNPYVWSALIDLLQKDRDRSNGIRKMLNITGKK